MKIYTKTGDKGLTSLLGDKRLKSDLRINCYGTVDELLALIGKAMNNNLPPKIKKDLKQIMEDLFKLNLSLVSLKKEVDFDINATQALEEKIDYYEEKNEKLNSFLYPIGCVNFADLNYIRTVVRRCERMVVELAQVEKVDNNVLSYLNRLSDYFFVIARYVNTKAEVEVTYEKN